MAEYANVSLQTVAAGGDVAFTETPVRSKGSVQHRQGSGLFTLDGPGRGQCFARYLVIFGGNVSIPAGGTVGPITLAISVEGEPLGSATMITTPAAVEEFGNVFKGTYVDVPCRCCASIGVRNLGEEPINVQNANLIITRKA